jgi:hypothetical protein
MAKEEAWRWSLAGANGVALLTDQADPGDV